jgi:uncharacterized repeat protein (TIGR01451 family)
MSVFKTFNMKKKLLLLIILVYNVVFAKDTNLTDDLPPIRIVMFYSYQYNPSIQSFEHIVKVKVKNFSEETLTNIQIFSNSPEIDFSVPFIEELAPNEESELMQSSLYFNNYDCTIYFQSIVYATTSSNEEVIDYSGTVTNFNNPNYVNSYLLDDYALLEFQDYFTNGLQTSSYQDLNNNGIVDLGDAIYYNYYAETFFNSSYEVISIYDDNAEVTFENGVPMGVHYITQAEINFGYVYNNAFGEGYTACGNIDGINYYGNNCPECPNPNNARMVTQITESPSHKITGNVKFNFNNNSCSTGLNFPRRAIEATTSTLTYKTFTDVFGNYTINIPNINESYVQTALQNLDSNFTSNPVTRTINTIENPTTINYNNNNYCISVDNDFNDVSLVLFNLNEVNPGFAANYRLYFQNNGSTMMNGTITLTFDSTKLQFSNSSPLPDVINTNTLTWNYSNLFPFEARSIAINFMTLPPPTVVIGDIISFTANINPILDDLTPINNTKILNQIAIGSYDPNDKTVLEGAIIEQSQANEYLTYLTRFQNSGTANATFVIIKEILDANLDWTTFTPIAESHNANIEIRNGNELTYTFPDINLPYEEIEPELSNGWMLYKIKLKNNFAIGDIASSSSDIYFDFNPPIITNTVTTEFAPLSVVENNLNNFKIIPNPASSIVTISMENLVNSTYEIVTINGKKLTEGTVENFKPIDISYLNNGFYFITITTENSKSTYKLIKN